MIRNFGDVILNLNQDTGVITFAHTKDNTKLDLRIAYYTDSGSGLEQEKAAFADFVWLIESIIKFKIDFDPAAELEKLQLLVTSKLPTLEDIQTSLRENVCQADCSRGGDGPPCNKFGCKG